MPLNFQQVPGVAGRVVSARESGQDFDLLMELIDLAQRSEVAEGLIQHLREAQQQLSVDPGRTVLPGLWSIRDKIQDVANEFATGLESSGENPAEPGPMPEPRTATSRPDPERAPTHYWTIWGDDGVAMIGPSTALPPETTLADGDDRVLLSFGQSARLRLHFDEDLSVSQSVDEALRANGRADPLSIDGATAWFDGIYWAGVGSIVGRVLKRLKPGWNFIGDLGKGTAGVLVGRVVYVAGRPLITSRDPTFRGRLATQEQRFSAIAQQFASQSAGTHSNNALVVVHGTWSTSFSATVDLAIPPTPNSQTLLFRFEHDTFRPVVDNMLEFEDFLKFISCERLLILAHSRGGLVATKAFDRLRERNMLPASARLYTFGTPFEGTPFAGAGYRGVSSLLQLISTATAVSSPSLDLFRIALANSRVRNGIQGIGDMVPDSALLRDRSPDPALWRHVRKFAGDARGVGGLQPDHRFVSRMVRGAFGAATANDLIVSVQSATANGLPCQQFNANHFQYFRETSVRRSAMNFVAHGRYKW